MQFKKVFKFENKWAKNRLDYGDDWGVLAVVPCMLVVGWLWMFI